MGAAIIGAGPDTSDVTETTGLGVALNAAAEVSTTIADNNDVAAGVLADNGGPVQTIALRADVSNPALDGSAADGADACGQTRGIDIETVDKGGTSDLGAFELQLGEDDAPPVFT